MAGVPSARMAQACQVKATQQQAKLYCYSSLCPPDFDRTLIPDQIILQLVPGRLEPSLHSMHSRSLGSRNSPKNNSLVIICLVQ